MYTTIKDIKRQGTDSKNNLFDRQIEEISRKHASKIREKSQTCGKKHVVAFTAIISDSLSESIQSQIVAQKLEKITQPEILSECSLGLLYFKQP